MASISIFNASELKPEQRQAAETLLGRPLESDEAITLSVSTITREAEEAAIRQQIQEKIDRGIEQLARGEGLDGEQVFDELEAELNDTEKASRMG
ncbi:MAG TPA: hypothetical protein VML01_11620 [Bryobacterales bacterium]|nr:hypothetical protein [Bryobacterales bacterium]